MASGLIAGLSLKRAFALTIVVMTPACSSNSNVGERGRGEWACFESNSCACRLIGPGEVVGSSTEVDECSDTECCLLTQADANDTGATCECLATSADCAAEAASRRGTQVVSQCPPPGEGSSSAKSCAQEGENCRQSYLDQHDLSGCCQGTVCKESTGGVPVCQVATPVDQSRANQCARLSGSAETRALELVTPTITTSSGTIQLPEPRAASYTVGTGGCLSSFRLTLGSQSACQLILSAENWDGKLQLADLEGMISGCAGYTGDPNAPLQGLLSAFGMAANLGGFTFDGLTCDGELAVESYCVAGSFDFRIDTIINGVTFDEQHLVLQGALCSRQPMGQCPAP